MTEGNIRRATHVRNNLPRRVYLRMACRLLVVLTASCCLAATAFAAPPPTPHVSGPVQVNNRVPLTLRFTFPPVHWSYQSFWHLWYHVQYWHCLPGKDSAPTEISLQAHPWPGQTNPCTVDDNYFLGLGPGDTGDEIRVPKQGGIPAMGTWYVRVRLVWRAGSGKFKPEPGPWSAWHRVIVVQSFNDVAKPPQDLAPHANQLFRNQAVDVRVMAALKHANPARWEYVFEWQRADYYTKANNQYANPHPKPTDFPRVLGQASPFQAWKPGMQALTLAESASPSTLHLAYTSLRSVRPDSSYIYRFRVHERLRNSNASGPWSDWHSFIVTGPTPIQPLHRPLPPLRRPMTRLRTH
jgi:hypothetical protein